MTKAFSLHRDQVEKQRYMVGQAGAKTAANVCITLYFLEQAKLICAEEIGLIDELIKKNNIPFPKTIPRTRPIIKFTAELLSTTQTSRVFDHDILRIKRTRRQGWQRFVRKKILHLLARTRVSHVGRRVLESARCGPVANVGEGIAAFALARFFIREGRDSVILSSGYGDGTVISPGYLQRPRIWYAAGGDIKNHLYYVMDYDPWFRMALAGASIYHVPAMIGCSRIHARQKTRENAEYHQVRQLVEEYLDLFCSFEAASR